MASHVVVIDSSARRAVIKTLPGKFLSDVLQEACAKLGLDSSRYGLRNNNRSLDLSRTIRLSSLSSGAKLELVVLSRSASAVSVALQLPESEAQGIPNQRLTDKFPSTTSLWLILRKFESDVTANAGFQRNFTARGSPRTYEASTGAGRLFHEAPVVQIMGRELASFADLQKTLGQLGFNSGSTLLRLSFRVTETPLEEAIEEIAQYFKSVETAESEGAHAGSVAASESIPDPDPSSTAEVDSEPLEEHPTPLTPPKKEGTTNDHTLAGSAPTNDLTISGPNHRPISVFAPPTSTTPHASLQPFNEQDYEPTIDHAKLHQSRLASSSRNKRLPTDAEIAAQQDAQKKKVAEVKEVQIKIRFPDQTQVVSTFSNADTAMTLYDFVRRLLENENEPFLLNFTAMKGPKLVPTEEAVKLVGGLGMTGKVLVNFIWDERATVEARAGKVLKAEFCEKAREIEIKEVEAVEVEDQPDKSSQVLGRDRDGEGKGKGKGIPKWLKLSGRK
ncbi:hypothetical protein MMC07_002959 [Pseudocyphellaria aurata]|nr:hypothetical protein [Pseudocyphellaria aurata]